MKNQKRDVRIEITCRHGNISDRRRAFAAERVSRLTRFNDRIHSIQVIIDRRKDCLALEMIVQVERGATFVGREQDPGFRVALDRLASKMERQLRKAKEKRKSHKGDAGLRKPALQSTVASIEEPPEELW